MPRTIVAILFAALVLPLSAVPVRAFCNGMGMETGSSFGCEDGTLGFFGPGGARSAFQRDDGSVGFLVGSGSSLLFSDDRGFGGSLLGVRRSRLIVTDDGRSGTAVRHGNTTYYNLDPPFDDDPRVGDPDRDPFGDLWRPGNS